MKKVIFDGDPGIDDALAIILALQSAELELLGITTVAGNVDVRKSTKNALGLLEYLGRTDIPVAMGNEKPLVRKYRNAESVHGADGLGNIDLPPPKLSVIPQKASNFIIDMVKNYPDQITLVATGPLTNVAEIIRKNNEFLKNIFEIVIMGGAIRVAGNVTPYAEYNIWADAEAAKIVFESGCPITLVPLDLTTSFILSSTNITKIEEANTPISKIIAKMLPYYVDVHKKRSGFDGCFIHDALAMAYAFDPTLVETEKIGIEIVIDKNEYYGQTKLSLSKPLIDSGIKVDSQKFLEIFINRMMNH
ncbi:MAG: nucleoside hydrolase [Candidatus Helarchaeota archaeon]